MIKHRVSRPANKREEQYHIKQHNTPVFEYGNDMQRTPYRVQFGVVIICGNCKYKWLSYQPIGTILSGTSQLCPLCKTEAKVS